MEARMSLLPRSPAAVQAPTQGLQRLGTAEVKPSAKPRGSSCAGLVVGTAAAAAAAVGAAGRRVQTRSRRNIDRRGRRARGTACRAVVAEVGKLGQSSAAAAQADGPDGGKHRPLQIIKIDLETNKVLIGEKEIDILEKQLKKTGVEKVAVVAVMGAFRTGKSFLLDLILRYLREKQGKEPAAADGEECIVPDWAAAKGIPKWAVSCGGTLLEGREGKGSDDLEGFIWRPGMEKCTEGVWVWSEVFVCKSGDEDVAVVIMDTQGAWDARMSKEQSATVFGLTTLMASRLVYNVSKQIQQDKIDNLLYFTDFALAALRAQNRSVRAPLEGSDQPFQKLEFLVRDWPHYEELFTITEAREMMRRHLDQYFDQKKSEDTTSVRALRGMFQDIDVWCLPHPSLKIERDNWDGNLEVVEKDFWRYINCYMDRIFSPEELQAKTNLGQAITVDTFGTVLREYIAAFGDAAPQAQSFSEAMEASTSLLARDTALKKMKEILEEKAGSSPSALPSEEFERIAADAAKTADEEFSQKAIFGTDEGIQRRKASLLKDVQQEIARAREQNDLKLEASLTDLTNLSLAALGAFVLDRLSDVTCDWWSPQCQDASTNLGAFYVAVTAFIGYSLYQIGEKQGQLNATAAGLELAKTVIKKIDRLTVSAQQAAKEAVDESAGEKPKE